MRKSITHSEKEKKSEDLKVVAPSAKTIEFLKAFARSYHAEKSLPESLSGYCIN